GVEERLARGLDQPRLGPLAAFGRVQEALVALMVGDATLDSCHDGFGLLEVRQQATDLLRVFLADQGLAGVAPGPAGRLDLEVMATPRVHPDVLAGARHADALLGRLVALHLRHGGLTLLSVPA